MPPWGLTIKGKGVAALGARARAAVKDAMTDLPENAASDKPLSDAARRALEEAALRRRDAAEAEQSAEELGGPKGLEPTRFGDWERKGIAVDF